MGVLLGAAWAYDAWGRYWGWDPKETWAFITWVVYAIYLHMRLVTGWRDRKTAYLSLAGFGVVVVYLYRGQLSFGIARISVGFRALIFLKLEE